MSVTTTTPVPFSVIEGQAFNGAVMDFTANDAGPFATLINWGDGTPLAGGTVTSQGGGSFEVSASGFPHTYAEDGTYTVTVAIFDTVDVTTTSNTTTATIFESVLSATGANFSMPEGSSSSVLTATFHDPGSADPSSDFTASIDWGDGTTTAGTITGSAGNYTVSGTHPYADEGSFTVTTTFFENNDSGFSISVSGTATITEADSFSNGAITLAPGAVGVPLTDAQVATFSDAGYPTNAASDFAATINWGDGATTAGTVVALGGGNFGVHGTHTYNKEGVYPVSVNVADDAPGTATITINDNVAVADAALTASPVSIDGIEGSPLTNIDVATFTDADPFGAAPDFLATVNWGDGTSTAGHIVEDSTGTFHVEGSHTYVTGSAAPWAVNVSITDRAGRAVNDPSNSTATTVSSANILDLPISASGKSLTGFEGRVLSNTVASFTDANLLAPASDFTASINWGDGHTTAGTVVKDGAGRFHVTGNHAYAADKKYVVKVTINDPGGSDAVATSSASIAESPLDSAHGLTLNKTKNIAFTNSSLGTFRDQDSLNTLPGTYHGTIAWGDGSAKSAASFVFTGATFNVGSFWTVRGSHKYTKTGTFTVTITLLDGAVPLTIFAKITVT
ncbi:MAG TPA: hypothetical protein VH370_12365 [Humisphaera sp.]|nr:hypothetical protein [Humisphaera sp.]